MKSQIISMDFVMTFVVYLLALSLFFFGLKESFFLNNNNKLDISYELLFNKITEIYDEEIDFLEGIKIDNVKFDNFLGKDSIFLYDIFFKDISSTSFKKISYCLFLENKNKQIIKNKAIYPSEDFSSFIYFDNQNFCGNDQIFNSKPKCQLEESILLKKPVLYNRDIYNLYLLICAE